MLETLTEIKDSKVDKLQSLCENNLPDVQGKLESALKGSQAILDNENKYNIVSMFIGFGLMVLSGCSFRVV